MKINKQFPKPTMKKVEYTNTILQQFKMFKYDSRVKIPAGHDLKINDYFENIEKYNNNYKTRPSYNNLLEFRSTKQEFLKILIEENRDISFLKQIAEEKEKTTTAGSEGQGQSTNPLTKVKGTNKVLIFPAFQFAHIKQNDDREALEGLLSSDYFTKVKIASGYMNLPDFLINILNKAKYESDIITAAPKSNGFYRAGRIKGLVPYFYRRFEYNLLRKLTRDDISLYEYEKEGWTYHSKGLWFYEKDKQYPTMTAIGSSNLSICNI
jgi:hypothetical protein